MWLFISFVVVTLIEIALFIQVGDAIGLWWTLLTVVLTAFIGSWLVRSQGAIALGQVKSSFSDMRDPTEPLVHGAMILFSGALLLTPGFFTDGIGFALLIPQVRRAAYNAIRARINIQSFETSGTTRQHQPMHGDIIEGEFTEVTEKGDTDKGPSEWTKH